MIKFLSFFLFLLLVTCYLLLATSPALAIVNPLSSPNNRFGIHLISGIEKEASDAASLVNSNGDWGYVTVLIESKQRDVPRWQAFFNDLRRRHLIPIVRLATEPQGDFWKQPYEGEEIAWADFLDALIWPTKNRYVTIYNEPNHASEWQQTVDPSSYAKVLDKTIDALKQKSDDFFVLNAGLDASAPQKLPSFMESKQFIKEMDAAVPGIFNKLDGWVSHSYPNPAFAGSPDAKGKGTIRSWEWELQVLNDLKVTKVLPIFITETGWKHSEGEKYDSSLPSAEKVASYYQKAFQEAWNNNRIVAVTPFILNYQSFPFDHFSFKKFTGEKQNSKILGIQYPEFYPQYQVLADLPKTQGLPVQEDKAKLEKAAIFKENLLNSFEVSPSRSLFVSLVIGEEYTLKLTVKNVGQSIWGEEETIQLIPTNNEPGLSLTSVSLPDDKKIEPGTDYTFDFKIRSTEGGPHTLKLNLFKGGLQFTSDPFELRMDFKSPVNLKIEAGLKWKSNFSGEYLLTAFGEIKNAINRAVSTIVLNSSGKSTDLETKYLLPDKQYNFTLEKPFYKPKTLTQIVHSGTNSLNFGELQPDIPSAILNPTQLWKLLPWSD